MLLFKTFTGGLLFLTTVILTIFGFYLLESTSVGMSIFSIIAIPFLLKCWYSWGKYIFLEKARIK